MSDNDPRDWRKSAYLNKENWPEAIPWMGPKRRYGPYPWGEPNDRESIDNYPSNHPDAASIGHYFMGSVCGWCGIPLDHRETVVLRSGEKGEYREVEEDVTQPEAAYHPECYNERRGVRNQKLTEWTE